MSDKAIRSRRVEESDETRRALVEAARTLFGADGYHQTGIEAIARSASVTRGALYYHFSDKCALFDSVVVEMQTEMALYVEAKARGHEDRWLRLRVGFSAYLDACLDPSFRRIVIQDSPVVLGMDRYLEIDDEFARRLLVAPVVAMSNAGLLQVPDVYLLSRMISAIMREAAQLIGQTADVGALRAGVIELVMKMLQGYRSL
jgi:AcrR family transcriptional regulator